MVIVTPGNPFEAPPLGLSALEHQSPAEWMYERLAKSIVEFEKELDSSQEIGARLVNFSAYESITIDDVGFWGPDIIKFYGKNAQGAKVELIQHISQLNVLLIAVKAEHAEPKRIGFLLEQHLKRSQETSEK